MTEDVNAEQAEAEAKAAEQAAAKGMINIITTDRGTFGLEGIAPVGTKRLIHFTEFSEKWMKPADLISAQRLKKLRKEEGAENGA